MRASLASLLLLMVTLASVARADEPKALAPYTKPTLIAHRGASWDAPEHTLTAYKLALEQGADYVEPDLQLTKDGVLVCLHDTTLERTTNVEEVFPDRAKTNGNGKKVWPVADFTLAEIQQLDAGSWKGSQFTGERVPTFQQMIDFVRGKAGIIPETKSPEAYEDRGLDMVAAVIKQLKENGLDAPGADPKTPVILQSFSADSLKALRKQGCKLPLVFLFSSVAPSKDRLAKMKEFADGIAPNKAVVLARPEIVADAHDLGMSVTVWTFRAGDAGQFETVRDEMRHFLQDLKVDAVFTDNPDQFPRD